MISDTHTLTSEVVKKSQLNKSCGITNSWEFKEDSLIRIKYEVKFNI